MEKKNKDCAVCHGKGKVKSVKTIAHFGSWYIGKETHDDPCFFCNLEEYNPEKDNDHKRILH